MIWLPKNLFHPEPGTPSEVSVLKEMKKWLLMLPSEEKRPRSFSKEDWRLRTENSERETFQILDVSVLVFKNTSILEWSMTHSLVFSEWISTSCWRDQEAELAWEEDAKAELEPSTKLAKKKLWNGSRESMTVLFTTDSFILFKIFITSSQTKWLS